MGTKRKIWLRRNDGRLGLFKYRFREFTGDDWAEKIASEIATLLAIPCAEVELASHSGEPGIVSFNFVPDSSELVHGNELLVRRDTSYPKGNRWRVAQHTVDRVLRAITDFKLGPPAGSSLPGHFGGEEIFFGYVVLDALIGNQDRHHENWAAIFRRSAGGLVRELAPSFDHASSLGHTLSDGEREARLTTHDSGYSVAAFVRKARSALYLEENGRRPLKTLEAATVVAHRYPEAAAFWRGRVESIVPQKIEELVSRVPGKRMTDIAKEFSVRMLACNRNNLLEVLPG